jgi:plasmid stabilization system protein ParE
LSYIAADDRLAAKAMQQRLDKAVRLLTEKPFMGPSASGLGREDLRRFSVPPYIVFYAATMARLEVVRVLHSSMDLDRPGLLDRRQ